MITGNVEKVIDWLKLNVILHWSLHTSNNTQGNNRIFESNDDAKIEDEYERMRQIVSLCQNPQLYIYGRQILTKTVNNFSETWRNMPDNTISGVQSGTTPSHSIGAAEIAALGYLTKEETDKRIAAAIEAERFKREREDFEREKEDFKKVKREFDNFKNGAIGTLLEKAMPYLGGIIGIEPKATAYKRVAGTSEPATAEAIAAVPPTPPNVPVIPDTPEPEIFDENESEKLFNLMKLFKEFDPEYLKIIEKIVTLATSGEDIVLMGTFKMTYEQLKETILNM